MYDLIKNHTLKDVWENGGTSPLIIITLIHDLATFIYADFSPETGGSKFFRNFVTNFQDSASHRT
jgi:hypothetical protein